MQNAKMRAYEMVRKDVTAKELALARALDYIGDGKIKRAADTLEIHNSTVWTWLHRGRETPGDHCLAVERAAHHQVTRYELRPDIYGLDPNTVIPEADIAEKYKIVAYATFTMAGQEPDRIVQKIMQVFDYTAKEAQAAYRIIDNAGIYRKGAFFNG